MQLHRMGDETAVGILVCAAAPRLPAPGSFKAFRATKSATGVASLSLNTLILKS